jgi:hypothetical protein
MRHLMNTTYYLVNTTDVKGGDCVDKLKLFLAGKFCIILIS